MESLQSSKKETLVAFRIAAKDLDFFKRMAEDHFKRGDIKTPTVAALCKQNLYWTCNMLKDLEKARILADQQLQRSIITSELEEPTTTTKIEDYDPQHKCYDNTYPYANHMTLQNQSGEDGKEDYNYDGKSIRRPFFYELYPNWEQRITKARTERKQ